jgi:MSHA biogenesis protein MshE
MRDQGTVETGLRAAITGHMVLSTLHTNDAVTTPIRLLDMGAPRYMVAMSLQIVIAQRLLRIVCESCSEDYQPTPQEHAWLEVAAGAAGVAGSFRKGRGCTQCNGTGYLGRTGVYEMLEMTRPVVDAASHADPAEFLAVARKQMEGETLVDHARALAISGRTTLDEAMRVSTQLDD